MKAYTFKIFIFFQQVFKVAISSWVETGIHQKMEIEITSSPENRGQFEESFWTRTNVQGNKPLTLQHVLPSFMIYGFGIISSMVVFILELRPCLKMKTSLRKSFEQDIVMGKDTNATIAFQHPIINNKQNTIFSQVRTWYQSLFQKLSMKMKLIIHA